MINRVALPHGAKPETLHTVYDSTSLVNAQDVSFSRPEDRTCLASRALISGMGMQGCRKDGMHHGKGPATMRRIVSRGGCLLRLQSHANPRRRPCLKSSCCSASCAPPSALFCPQGVARATRKKRNATNAPGRIIGFKKRLFGEQNTLNDVHRQASPGGGPGIGIITVFTQPEQTVFFEGGRGLCCRVNVSHGALAAHQYCTVATVENHFAALFSPKVAAKNRNTMSLQCFESKFDISLPDGQ